MEGDRDPVGLSDPLRLLVLDADMEPDAVGVLEVENVVDSDAEDDVEEGTVVERDTLTDGVRTSVRVSEREALKDSVNVCDRVWDSVREAEPEAEAEDVAVSDGLREPVVVRLSVSEGDEVVDADSDALGDTDCVLECVPLALPESDCVAESVADVDNDVVTDGERDRDGDTDVEGDVVVLVEGLVLLEGEDDDDSVALRVLLGDADNVGLEERLGESETD